MQLKPWKSRVRVIALDGAHLYHTTPADAEAFVRKGLAEQQGDAFAAFIGVIRLTRTLADIRGSQQKPKGRPRPNTRYHDVTKPNPDSSLPHLYRSDTGRTGGFRTLVLRPNSWW